MRKFVLPEISCVELSETDAIMASIEVGKKVDNYKIEESTLDQEYKIWKGFEN